MTDVFRSEILGSVMQQIVDEPVLPVLFLRTVGRLDIHLSAHY
jgi:symplekin